LTFVVVGAGPTGVELAGALAEIARHTLLRDFRKIDPAAARVLLVEAADRVLPPYVDDLSAKARTQLEHIGVSVWTGTRVTGIDHKGVDLGDERIDARTVLWAAGVAASPLGKALGVPVDRAGRVRVEKDLTVPGNERVYVVGDLAYLEQDGAPLPGVAAVAIQGARHAVANIFATMRGEPRAPFRYIDKGSLATIGRAAAVADFGPIKLSGFGAWMAWLFIHVLLLIGFRNRFVVLFEWAWSYVTYDRGARLITGEGPRGRGAAGSREETPTPAPSRAAPPESPNLPSGAAPP
jgi:NADH dehydrogenase